MKRELTPKIVRNVVPNPQCLSLDVNIRISTHYIERFSLPLHESSKKDLNKVGPIGAALIYNINSILGCESVSIKQYGVQVIVGDAFDPDTDGITNEVIEALKDCFGDKRAEVEVSEKSQLHLYREDSRYSSSLDDDSSMQHPNGDGEAFNETERKTDEYSS